MSNYAIIVIINKTDALMRIVLRTEEEMVRFYPMLRLYGKAFICVDDVAYGVDRKSRKWLAEDHEIIDVAKSVKIDYATFLQAL